jgi:hypothetical protein
MDNINSLLCSHWGNQGLRSSHISKATWLFSDREGIFNPGWQMAGLSFEP